MSDSRPWQIGAREQLIDRAARAAWERNRAIFNASEKPERPLLSWEEEPGVQDLWRHLIEAALVAIHVIKPGGEIIWPSTTSET